MFQLNAPKYRRGEPIVIVWDEDITGLAFFSLADFVTDVSTMTIKSIFWDFGDGTAIESTIYPAISGQSHRYATPGRKTLRVEIRYSGLDWASGSFDPSPAAYQVETIWSYVDVVLDPNRMATAEGETRDATIPVSAGIQLTFEDGTGRTHALFPFLNSSAPAAGAEYGFYQENTGTSISADSVQSAIREAVESFRYSYYAGFSRLQSPRKALPRAFYLHTPADVHLMALPSSSTEGMAQLEELWHELQSRTQSGAAETRFAKEVIQLSQQGALDTRGVGVPAFLVRGMTPLGYDRSVPALVSTHLRSGENSILYEEVIRYLNYLYAGSPSTTAWGSAPVSMVRRVLGAESAVPPPVDPTSAWTWDLSQAVVRSVVAFWAALGPARTGLEGSIVWATYCEETELYAVNVVLPAVDVEAYGEITNMGVWAKWCVQEGAAGGEHMTLDDLVSPTPPQGRGAVRGLGIVDFVAVANGGATDEAFPTVFPMDIKGMQDFFSWSTRTSSRATASSFSSSPAFVQGRLSSDMGQLVLDRRLTDGSMSSLRAFQRVGVEPGSLVTEVGVEVRMLPLSLAAPNGLYSPLTPHAQLEQVTQSMGVPRRK